MHQFKVRFTHSEADAPVWTRVRFNNLPRSCGCDGTLEEWIVEELDGYGFENVEVIMYRELPTNNGLEVTPRMVGVALLSLYFSGRSYGGPEEGGWYYTTYDVIRTFAVPKKYAPRAEAIIMRYLEKYNEGVSARDGYTILQYCRGVPLNGPRPHYC